jgi:hypothetical protein
MGFCGQQGTRGLGAGDGVNETAKIFDRSTACGFAVLMAVIAVAGMWFHNADVAEFGKLGFATFSGVLVTLLNKELLNGNGNKNGSGPENPMQAK